MPTKGVRPGMHLPGTLGFWGAVLVLLLSVASAAMHADAHRSGLRALRPAGVYGEGNSERLQEDRSGSPRVVRLHDQRKAPEVSSARRDTSLEEEDDEEVFDSGEQFDRMQKYRRQMERRRKWLADLTAEDNGTQEKEDEEEDVGMWPAPPPRRPFDYHPIFGHRHPLFWKFQFALILAALCLMYVLQVLVDFKGRKKIVLLTRPSTCLILGANFRGLGETRLVSAARFLTCTFLHAHIFHLFSNCLSILAAWVYFSPGPGMKDEHIWVYHWTFPIFMLAAFAGSLYSYRTTLLVTGFSIGASGGCLGLSGAFLFLAARFEGLPPGRRGTFILTIISILASCIPWDALFGSSEGQSTVTDLGAHIAGAAGGLVFGTLLSLASAIPAVGPGLLVQVGDGCSVAVLILLVLAYLEVIREFFVDGKELIVRAYVKFLGMTDEIEEDDLRRRTAPGRLQCELLTEEYLYLLESEKLEDDPETILRRLEMENKSRRKTFPELGGVVY